MRKKAEILANARVVVLIAIILSGVILGGFVFSESPHTETRAVSDSVSLVASTPHKTGVFGYWTNSTEKALLQSNGSMIYIYDTRGRLLESHDMGHTITLSMVADVDGDGLDEAFVGYRDDTVVKVDVIDQDWSVIKTFSKQGASDSGIRAWYYMDLDGDGSKEVICSVGSGYSTSIRGVVVFDYNTATEEWFGDIAPSVTNIEIGDIDGDGTLNVVASSYAPSNGKTGAYGDDDSHSYIYVWANNGSFMWKYNTGDYFTGCYIRLGDIKQNGSLDVIATVYTAEDFRSDLGKLLILDGSGNLVNSRSFSYGIHGLVVGDIDPSISGQEIVIGSNNYACQIYDSNLNLLYEYVFTSQTDYWHYIVPQFIYDWDGDSEAEIMAVQYERHEITHDVAGSTNQLTDVKFVILSKEMTAEQILNVVEVANNTNKAESNFCNCGNKLIVTVYADRTYIFKDSMNINKWSTGTQIENFSLDGDNLHGGDIVYPDGRALIMAPDWTPVPDVFGWVQVNADGTAKYYSENNGKVSTDARSLEKDGNAYVVGMDDGSYSPPSDIYTYKYNFDSNSITQIFEYHNPKISEIRMTRIDLFSNGMVLSGSESNSTGDAWGSSHYAAIYFFDYNGNQIWNISFPSLTPSGALAVRNNDNIFAYVGHKDANTGTNSGTIYKISMDGTYTKIANTTNMVGSNNTFGIVIRDMKGVDSTIGFVETGSNNIYVLNPENLEWNTFKTQHKILNSNEIIGKYESYYAYSYKSDDDIVYLSDLAGDEYPVYKTTGSGGGGISYLTDGYVFDGFGLHPTDWGTGHVVTYLAVTDNDRPQITDISLNGTSSGTSPSARESYNVTATVTDNVAVYGVWLNYTMVSVDGYSQTWNISMNNSGANYWHNIDVWNNATWLNYTIWANDTSNNWNTTGEMSTEVLPLITPPSSPQNLQAISGDGYVNLTWDPPADSGGSAVTYSVLRTSVYYGPSQLNQLGGSPTDELPIPPAIPIGNVTWYNDTLVTNGKTYYYWVLAVNDAGASPFSESVNVTLKNQANASIGSSDLLVSYDGTGNISIVSVEEPNVASPENMTSVNLFFEMQINGSADNLTITISYDDSQLSDTDENSLTLYRLNNSVWEPVTGASVDAKNNKVTAPIDNPDGIYGLYAAAAGTEGTSTSGTSSFPIWLIIVIIVLLVITIWLLEKTGLMSKLESWFGEDIKEPPALEPPPSEDFEEEETEYPSESSTHEPSEAEKLVVKEIEALIDKGSIKEAVKELIDNKNNIADDEWIRLRNRCMRGK